MSVRPSPSGLRRSRLFTTSAFGALALAALWAAPAHAQLVQTGASSNGGAPVVDQSVPNATTVTLNGSRTVIDWSQFDIDSGERADFIFANRSDIVLNRVGGAASTINGDLNGMVGAGGPTSGNIWIYNANGVVIGANARINTGGLLVTTAALDRADDSSAGGFLDGSSTSFGFTGSATGSGITVQNGAQITSRGGAIALVAPVVTTEAGSSISAQAGGNVLYGAASKYKISFRQTGTDDLDLIGFEVAGSADGTGETGGITMGGATSGNRVFAAVVSKTGVIADIVGTGAVTATNVAMDETGAIVLLGNHNLVNGAAGGMVANAGTSDIKLHSGGTLTAPAVSLVTSDSINTNHTATVSALGGTIDLLAKNGVIFGTGRFNTGTFTAESYGTLWLNGTNNIGTLGGLRNTTNDLVFVGNGNLNIAGDIVSSGEANVSVNGVASGSGLIRAPRAVVSGGGTFNLDSAATLRYVSAYAGNLTVISNGNLLIDLSGAANDYGHTVTLNAASGGIRQTSGDALVGRVAANARDAIDLGALNQFTDITANSTDGGDIHLRAANAVAFAGSTTGNMTVDAAGRVTVGGLLEAGTLNIVAGGDIDLNRSVLDIGSYNSLISSGNISVTTDSTISIGGAVSAGVGKDVSLVSNTGAINQTAGMISGRHLHIQASGSIVQDSIARMVGFGMVTNSVTAGGDLILAGSNQIDYWGPAMLGWGAGRDVTYHSANNIYFEGGGTAIGALNLIVDSGSIQQGSVAFTADSFSASATGDIDIGTSANNSIARLGDISSSAGEVRLRVGANDPLAIDGTVSSASRVILTAHGALSGAGAISAPHLYLSAIGGGTVNVAGSTILDTVGTSNGDLTLHADGGLTVGQVAGNGRSITLVADTGDIVGGSTISAVTTLTVTAGGNIDLQNPYNDITNFVGTSTGGGSIKLAAYNPNFAVDTSGDVLIHSNWGATATGMLRAGTLDVTVDSGDISINTTGDAVGSYGNLLASNGNVSVTTLGTINLAGDVSALNGGTAALTSTGGAVSQASGTITATSIALGAATTISQGAGAALRGTNLSLTSGGNVVLGEANDFTTITDLAVGGDLTLRNLGSIDLSPILGGTGNYGSGGALTLVSDTGSIRSTNAGVITSRLSANAAGFITLDGTIASLGTITAGQDILLTTYNGSMDLTGNVAGRRVSLYGNAGLTQSGGIIDTERLNVITNGAISLTGANQIDVVGRLDTDQFDSGTGHDITLRNSGAIVLDYLVEAAGGTVTLTADSGGISQTSFSTITAGTLEANATGDIVFDQASNDVDHLGAIRSTGGKVSIVDADAVNISRQVRAAGALSLTAGGAITSVGGLVVAGGALNVSATSADLAAGGNIQLGTIATSGNFAIDTDQDITVAGTINTQGNTATLTAGLGAINQSGSGNILNGSAVATALNGINFGGDNRLTSFSGTSTGGGNIVFNDGGSGGIVVGLNTTGNATVTVGGNISSSGITVDSLSMEGGHIDLTNGVDVNSFTHLVAAYGDILVTNAGSFTVAGDVTTNKPGLRTIDLRANGGGISQTAGTISGHYVSLRGTGDLIQSGSARIDSNAAYFSGVNVLLGGANSLVSNDTDIVATGNLTLRNAGAIDLTAMGGYTAGGVLTLTSDTDSITATDAITASALTALAANGAVTFNNTNNLISEIRGLSAATNATIVSRNGGFTLTGDIDVGGTLALRAGTGINQTGGRIRATTLDAQLFQTMTTGSVLLGGANDVDNLYVLAASGGGDVLYRDTDGFRVTYAVIGNRVTLTSEAGAITQVGGFIDGVHAIQLSVSAVDGISLNNQWNGIRTILGLTNTGSGGIDVGGRGINMVIAGNVTAAGQAVSLTAQNASLTQASGSITADTLNASAGTGIVLDKANAITRLGTLTNATSGGIRANDATGDLDLAGTVTAAGQAVRFDTAGSLTQSAALGAYSNLTINAGTGLILDQANNFGATTFSLSTTSGDITVRNVGNLTLPALAAAGGTIRLISDTGTIGQTGVLTANTLIAAAYGDIDLGLSNVITNVAGLTNSVGAIRFTDVDGFNITGDIRARVGVGDRVYLTAGGTGSIAQTGGAIVADKFNATAGGNLTLDGSANEIAYLEQVDAGGDLTLRVSGAFEIGQRVTAGGTARLTSTTGHIFALPGFSAYIRASELYVNAATGINLDLPGNITPRVSLITAMGNIRYSAQGALEFLALRTPMKAIVRADTLTQSGAIDVGDLEAVAAGIRLDMAGNRIGSLDYVVANGGDLAIADEDGFDISDDLYASGAISLTAGGTGSITQSGGIITAPTVSLVAAGGNIALDGANAVGVYNARSAIGGTITLRNDGDLTVNAITAQNGTVNLTSNTGSVGQLLVPGNSIWTRTLNVNAATDIDLAAQNFTELLGNLTAGGSIRYNSFNTLGLDGDIRAGGGVTFGISGYLGQYSGTVTASHLDVTATGIALIGANDIGSATASIFSAADDITFRSVNSILLGPVSTPGLLSLTSDGGDIRQSAAFSAGRFDAIAAGDIVLDQLNTLDTVNDVTAGGVFSLRTAGALVLDGRIAADDRVTFNTGGGLTQIGNTVIVTDRLEATAGTATTTGIRLLNHNRVGTVSFDASGNDIRFRNTGNIAINAINSPSGTVELISNVGRITQQAGGGLVAGSLVLDAGNGVELYNADNQIARLDVISRGMVSIHTGSSGFGGLLTVDRIDAAGQTVLLGNYAWGITGGNITAATLNAFSAGDMDLGTTNHVAGNVGLSGRNIIFTNLGDLVIDRVLSSLGNAVLRSEEGAISQTGSAPFDTTGLTAYGRDGVQLAGGIRRIDGLSAGPGADVEVVSSRALELAGDISARNVLLRSNASPDMFTPTGGAITQTGGTITAELFRGSAYGAIDLGRSNQIAALGDVWSFTGGINFTTDRALDLTGAVTAINGDVVLDAASIGQSGGHIEAAGLRARAAGAINLDLANQIAATGTVALDAGADIAFRNGNSLAAGMIDTPGAVTLTALNGSITQAASTRIGAGRLTVSAANGGITLDEANLVDALGGLTAGGDIGFRNAGDFALDGDIAAASHEVTLRSNTGAISQASGTITALGLSAAAGGAITLGGANSVTNLRDVTAGGDFLYRNAGALMLWGDVTAAGHDVTLSTDSGSLLQMLFTSGVITANRLSASAGGALNLNHANRVHELGDYASGSGVAGFTNDYTFSLTGDISGDELVLTALNGGIHQLSGSIDTGSILASARESIDLGGANQVAAAGPVRLVSTNGDVTFRALGDFTLDFGSAWGTFDVTSDNGSITQSGAINASLLNARAGGGITLTLDNAVASLGRLSAGAAGDIAFTSAGDLLLTDAIDAGGAVTLVANIGEIMQSGGAITAAALTASAAQDIVLGGANTVAAFAGTSANGDIGFRNTGSVSLGMVSLPGMFTLTSDAGAVTQTGDLTAGGLTVTARDGITLTRSGNAAGALVNLTNLGAGSIAYTDSGSILIGTIGAAGQAVTLNAGGDIDQMTGIEAAVLNLTATGGVTLTQSAGNLIGSLGTVDVRRLILSTAGDLDLAGAIAARDTLSLVVNGRLTQSGGQVTTPSLTLQASGIDLGEINQVDTLTANNGGGMGGIRFVNGRSLIASNLSSDGDLTLRVTAGQLTLGGTISSLGNMDMDAAGDIGGAASIDSRQSVRVASGGSIDLQSVSGRDDILIDAAGDARVRELFHLTGAADAAGNGYIVNILGNNVTLGASSSAGVSASNRLRVDTNAIVSLGARAGDATLNLATMDRGVSIAATGDVRAFAIDDLNLVNVSGTNISLSATTGGVGADRVDVAGNYTLNAPAFYRNALQPLGARAGTWTLATSGDLDALGRTLEFGGGIDFTIGGTLSNGTVRSLNGSVAIIAGIVDLYQISAAAGIDATANAGDLGLFSADTAADDLRLTGGAVRVTGSLEAGSDIAVLATTGDAVIGYATTGRNIAISAAGDATLRQATLTGATGDLTIGAGGSATLGDDDATGGIGTDRWFERAAGSTGIASIAGGTGVVVNLDHSAKLDNVSAELVEINVATGDLAIGQLTATSHGARVDVANGALTIGGASAAHGSLDLYADGDLTLLSHAGALDIYLTAGGLLDTRAAPVNGTDYVELTGGEIRAGTIGSGGDIDVFSTSGAIAVDSVVSTGGNAIFNAFTDLNLGRVVANGGQLQAGGNATVRAIAALDGFALLALGNITLGADTAALIASDNLLVTGGSLGGCACGSGGATLISLGGDVRVNLQSATGVFDTIAAAVDGDANVHIATGDLGIGDLAAHNIAVTLPGGTLTVMNAVSSGGDYMLTAHDFGGNALLPVFGGGATTLNNVSITDTDGDLAAGSSLFAAGDIRVSSVGNITGALSLLADGDVEVSARAIRLGDVAGRDIVLDASAGDVDVVGTVTVGRGYTLTGTDFSANALAAGGARLGDLLVTDTAGDFAYGTLDLGFAGAATIRANGGAIRGGDIATLGDLDLSGAGVVAGTLRSDQGGVRVDSSASVDLAGVRANDAIDVNADGNLRLGNAALTGTGLNSFALAAGGDLLFGAASAAAIGNGDVFTSAGSAMTGGGLRADGAILVNLDRAAELTGIDGGILELTVRNGDLSIGNIRTVGALFVTGPGGTLSIGDIETSAGHIGIAGQGNVTAGAVSGRFVVDIGSSAGSVAFRKVTGGDVTLAAASGITAVGLDAGVFADSLGLSAGGNVDLATNGTGSRISRLRAITVANGDFALRNLQGLVLDGAIDVRGGTLNLQLAGALSQSSGVVVAQHLVGNIAGPAQLGGANSIASLGDFTADGLLVNNATALGIEGVVDGGAGSVTIRSHGGMTIGATGAVRSASNGDAIILASDGLFRNLAGGTALAAANGRWLVYTQALGNSGASDPANAFGGLAGQSFYGAAYDFATGGFGGAPNAGNRFVYGYRPVLTVRPSDLTITYNGQIPVLGAGITGLVNGDSAADAWSGAAHLSGAGRNAGTYTIAASLGSLASDMNYDFAFSTGTLRIDPRAITATLAANGKIYDGTTSATGTLLLGGVIAGDDVTVTGALGFADKNAGAGKMVTANGIALNGADAGNYTVNLTATSLADILARTITATLAANGKTYDGTAAATGTLSLGGVLAGDDVGVSGALAFADKNAGIGKTVTASGIALSGADAGNYVVDTTTTGLADILARTITATLAANGKTYDGTTATTGTLLLGGVLAGDMVNATGSYSFADKNAGTGKTVTASGIALGGADAGNYIVNATATDVADILARAITATLAANGKTYDGTTGATGTLSLGGVVAGDDVVVSGSYAFADKNAGSGKTVTASGIALGGADAGNYVVNTTATGLADILARAITATLAANGKVYDGTAGATGTLSLGGVLAGDQVGATGSYAFADKNAGTGKTVTANGITLGGADAGNYVVNTTATGLADILAKAVTATLAANGKIYDGTTGATGALSLGGVVAGDDLSVSGTLAFADKNAGTGKAVTANGITLAGADAGNYTVNSSAIGLADILARTITATLAANGKTYDGTTGASGALSLGGVVAGDDVTVSGALAFADKNAATGKTVTASGIRLAGADAGNYAVNTTATGLADILARTITATLAANDRTYDGTTAATGTLSLGGILAGDQVGVTGGIAFDSRNAGERIVTASGLTLNGADAGNYIVNASATDIATIARLGITGKAVADSRIYDGTVATTGRITLDGVLAGDAVSVAADYAFADPNAGVGRIVSVSGLALTGADAGNYAVTLDPGPVLADILLRPVTVAADDLFKIFGMRDPALSWRVTGGSLVGSDAFTGMLERTPGEQVGIYAIGQGSLALSSNYALTFVPGTFAIRLTQSGADASDALRRRRPSSSFSLYEDPSANLKSDPGEE